MSQESKLRYSRQWFELQWKTEISLKVSSKSVFSLFTFSFSNFFYESASSPPVAKAKHEPEVYTVVWTVRPCCRAGDL